MFLSSLWPWRICLALPGESGFPYLPWLVPWYLSLDLMVPLVTLLAPDLDTLRRVYRAMLVQTGVAALVYTVVPQRLGFFAVTYKHSTLPTSSRVLNAYGETI